MGRACCLCVSLICSCRSFNGVSSLAVVVPSLYIIAFPCRLSVSLIRSVIILYGPLSEFPSISVAHRHSVSVTSKKKKASCLPMFVCIRCVCAFHCTYVHAYIYRHVRGGRAIYHLPLHEFPTSSSWMAAGLQWSLGKQKLLTDANLYLCVKNTNKQSAKVRLEKKTIHQFYV